MKKYIYEEPDKDGNNIKVIKTEEEILENYWKYWSSIMERLNKHSEITKENCILDWCVVHWAYSQEENDNDI